MNRHQQQCPMRHGGDLCSCQFELPELSRRIKNRHFKVSFDIECHGKSPTTGDIKDALGQFFERDVLKGKIANFEVSIDYEKEIS